MGFLLLIPGVPKVATHTSLATLFTVLEIYLDFSACLLTSFHSFSSIDYSENKYCITETSLMPICNIFCVNSNTNI